MVTDTTSTGRRAATPTGRHLARSPLLGTIVETRVANYAYRFSAFPGPLDPAIIGESPPVPESRSSSSW